MNDPTETVVQGLETPPLEAYQGNEPYLFVSYAHRDQPAVYPIILRLHNAGFRIWYDEGISPGHEWPEEIALALEGAACFLVFISAHAIASQHVKNEIYYALDRSIPFLTVHLEPTDLSPGLALRMGDLQSVMKYRVPEENFFRKLEDALLEMLSKVLTTAQDGDPAGQAPGKVTRPKLRSPYKYLANYEEDDSDIFFGRRHSVHDLAGKIKSHRFMILFGQSGAGKTSFIKAGLMPAMRGGEAAPVYLRMGRQPLEDIRVITGDPVSGHPLILFMDQFEDVFHSQDANEAEAVFNWIATTVFNTQHPIHIVLSLREDYLGALFPLRQRLRIDYSQEYRLKPLSRSAAKAAIQAPLRPLNIAYHPDLLSEILDDLADERGEIFPPHVQIVCQRLYESLGDDADHVGLAHYHHLGGAARIIADFLDDALMRFSQSGRQMAKKLLTHLVSPSNTRQSAPFEALAAAIADLEPLILQTLQEIRLIRSFESGGQTFYELSHDYMVDKIRAWVSEEELELRKARWLLARERENWDQFRSIMNRERLLFIEEHLADMEPDDAETAFLAMTAFYHRCNEDAWSERLTNPALLFDLLQEMARSDKAPLRAASAHGLRHCLHEKSGATLLHLILEDDDLAVREEAAASLFIHDPDACMDILGEKALRRKTRHGERCLWAMTTIFLTFDATPYRWRGIMQREKILTLLWHRIQRSKGSAFGELSRLGALGGFFGGAIISSILGVFFSLDPRAFVGLFTLTEAKYIFVPVYFAFTGGIVGFICGYLAAMGVFIASISSEVFRNSPFAGKKTGRFAVFYKRVLTAVAAVTLPYAFLGGLIGALMAIYGFFNYDLEYLHDPAKGILYILNIGAILGAFGAYALSAAIVGVFTCLFLLLPERIIREGAIQRLLATLASIVIVAAATYILKELNFLGFSLPAFKKGVMVLYWGTGGIAFHLLYAAVTTFAIAHCLLKFKGQDGLT